METQQLLLEDSRIAGSTLLVHRIFEAQAEARPDAVAVVFGLETITYGELDARANRIARYLRRRGARPGATVATMMPRSIGAYASILGILKAGAAYVPIDPEYPAERIAWMLEDSGASIMLTTAELDDRAGEIAAESSAALPVDEDSANPGDLCYVIYTSGSTGKPKGVMVEHRHASHLVIAEAGIFRVQPGDSVYQGAPLCFDLSVEEIWLAFQAGAALVAATPEMTQAGPDLSRHLTECGVTVLSCVPSLLLMLEEDVPTLRLLILGGETCPQQLIARWTRRGRRIVNTYGPTETTVIATYAELFPGMAVTIGRPVPGYEVDILDDCLRAVVPGETGEICIGGAGVARGYRGLPGETRARFVPDGRGGRIFRSGDLGRMDIDGNIEFLGRADGQVKLRGLRIELGEIEAALLEADGVRAAACALHENERGDQQIVGYVVPGKAGSVSEERILAQVRRWLPGWMAPSLIETIYLLPRLPSGKLDRASLPAPRARTINKEVGTDTESRLLEAWSNLFYPRGVSLHDDFFRDLGGHSLLAAHMVSLLRGDSGFASLTMRDIYQHPTISQLAAFADAAGLRTETGRPRWSDPHARLRHFVAGALQTLSLYFVLGFRGAQWIAPWLVYFVLARHRTALVSAAWAVGSGVALFPISIAITVGAKWCLLGRVRPGGRRLWGAWYVRWWLVQTLVRSVPLKRLGGTPLLPFVYRLFGAHIGRDVHIATENLAAFDVISIGDGTSIDEGASLLGYTVEEGNLLIGAVSVGHRCFVGTRSVLSPNTAMEDDARLEDLSLLPGGTRIPAGETWAGSPPRRMTNAASQPEPPFARGRLQQAGLIGVYFALASSLPLIELIAFVPGVLMLTRFHLAELPMAGASFIVCLTGLITVLKWILIGRAHAGTFAVDGWFYVRNWMVEQLLALSVDVAGPLHSTLFLKPWYRALGAKLGRFAEVSNASVTTPDLLDIGEESTIADEVSLGAARVESGWLTLAPTRLGRRVFVGNSAVVPAGTVLDAGTLVGVLTMAPAASGGAAWLGSPPILLPRRQPCTRFSEVQTFRPGRKLQWTRGCVEFFRVTLPGAGFLVVTVGVLETALKFWDAWGPGTTLLALPVVFAGFCAAVLLAVAAAKWIVIGRYRPFQQPLWSLFVWRLELVNALFEFLASPLALEALEGTPLLPWYLRLLGARIGRRVYVDTIGFLEFDLVEVGDRAILNKDCVLQTHLFEDRVMKASRVRVGADCEIGAQSIVLYDTDMNDRARLGPLSLLMKGETLPPGKVWTGSPLSS